MRYGISVKRKGATSWERLPKSYRTESEAEREAVMKMMAEKGVYEKWEVGPVPKSLSGGRGRDSKK
jgi:hypothetical protein